MFQIENHHPDYILKFVVSNNHYVLCSPQETFYKRLFIILVFISFIRSISGLSDNRAQIRLVYQPDQSQVVWAELHTGEHLNLEWSAGNQPGSVLERSVCLLLMSEQGVLQVNMTWSEHLLVVIG